MEGADIVFITVGTPSKRLEEEADLSAVWNVAKEIAKNIEIFFNCNKIYSTCWNYQRD